MFLHHQPALRVSEKGTADEGNDIFLSNPLLKILK